MSTYIVTFEISDDKVLTALTDKLKTFGGYCPSHKNAWAISTDKKAIDIRDALTSIIKPNDRVFVIRSGTEAAWWNSYGQNNNDWLIKYL